MSRSPFRLFAVILTWVSCSALSSASTPGPWFVEQWIDRCDRMGVVRCITGGRSVASFEIVEAWKGGGIGETVTIGFSNPAALGDRPPFMLVS